MNSALSITLKQINEIRSFVRINSDKASKIVLNCDLAVILKKFNSQHTCGTAVIGPSLYL